MSDTARLVDTVDRFCRFIATLPASALVEQDWGPKEVLAHLVYYHELYVDLIEGILASTPVVPPRGRFQDLNAQAIAVSRGKSPAELVDRLRTANRRLVTLYQQHDPSEITVVIKAGTRPRTLAQLVPEVEAHIRNRLEQLRKELGVRASPYRSA